MCRQARSCRLFEGVQTKCMDALLNASKVELFMPKVGDTLSRRSSVVTLLADMHARTAQCHQGRANHAQGE